MSSSLAPSTTSSSSIVATATAILALTTPFVEPPECTGFWKLTSTTNAWTTNQTIATLLISDAPLEQYASCQPPGWASVVPTSRFSFSPAVCPSDWAYFTLASTISSGSGGHYSAFSTAWCCERGYALGRPGLGGWKEPIPTDTPYCYRSFSGTRIIATLSDDPESTQAVTSGYQIHLPWHISWHESDRSTLTPEPPDLTSEKYVPTWTGQVIPPGMYDMDTGQGSDSSHGLASLFQFLVIGLPLIGISLVACVVGCIFYYRPSARARRAQRRKEKVRAYLQASGHIVTPETQEPPSSEETREPSKEAPPVAQPR